MKNILYLLLLMPLFFSCEKIIFEKDGESTNPRENFDYLWKQADEKYSYFLVKNVNWDSIKVAYSSRIYDGMSDDSLFNVLGGMLDELRDDHTNLISKFNISSYGVFYSGPDNFDFRVVEENYLNQNFVSSGPFKHDFISNGEIGYVRFGAFTGTVDDVNLDYVINRYQNTKGLILDLRENGGGAVTDMYKILERFLSSETTLFYSRIKNGPGHDDFTDPEAAVASPYNGPRYLKKVAVLIDRGTFSAGSFTSLSTKALPNMVLIGDTTGGGLGLPNGGQLPNGWNYRFSVSQALTLDMNNMYENGVPPDIYQLFDWSDMTKDEVIERAIIELQ